VMFSDESHFELRMGNQGWRCRRSKGSDRFDLNSPGSMSSTHPRTWLGPASAGGGGTDWSSLSLGR
jgi:hypothetical protein